MLFCIHHWDPIIGHIIIIIQVLLLLLYTAPVDIHTLHDQMLFGACKDNGYPQKMEYFDEDWSVM